MLLVLRLVAHCRHHHAAAAAEIAHGNVVGGGAVVRTHAAADAQVEHPGFSCGLSRLLDEFGTFHDVVVAQIVGHHDDVGLGRHAVIAVAVHHRAGGNVGDVRGMAGTFFVAVAARRQGREGLGVVVIEVPGGNDSARFVLRFEGNVVVLESHVDDADHDAFALVGGLETRVGFDVTHARQLARFVHIHLCAACCLDGGNNTELRNALNLICRDAHCQNFVINHVHFSAQSADAVGSLLRVGRCDDKAQSVSRNGAARGARIGAIFAQIDLRLRVEFLTSVLYFLCHAIPAKENG